MAHATARLGKKVTLAHTCSAYYSRIASTHTKARAGIAPTTAYARHRDKRRHTRLIYSQPGRSTHTRTAPTSPRRAPPHGPPTQSTNAPQTRTPAQKKLASPALSPALSPTLIAALLLICPPPGVKSPSGAFSIFQPLCNSNAIPMQSHSQPPLCRPEAIISSITEGITTSHDHATMHADDRAIYSHAQPDRSIPRRLKWNHHRPPSPRCPARHQARCHP